MALATTKPSSFSFHDPSTLPLHEPFRAHFPVAILPNQSPTFASPLNYLFNPRFHHRFALSSIDVSKEDKPVFDRPPSQEDSSAGEEKEKLERRRLEERFAVLNTGIYECRSCGYRYNETAGNPSYPIPPWLRYEKLPENLRCPICRAAKSFFESKSVELRDLCRIRTLVLGLIRLREARRLC